MHLAFAGLFEALFQAEGGRMSEWMVYMIGAVVVIIVAVLVLRHINRDPKSPGV